MAKKKFFYNRVYNTKRTIINLIIVGVCIIGIILCFVITSNFQGEDNRPLDAIVTIKNEVTIEAGDAIDSKIYFSKLENYDIKDVKITYPENFNNKSVGEYEVTLNINGKNYTTKLKVIDTKKPTLVLKNVSVLEGTTYTANDFLVSCTDNSATSCNIDFYKNGINQDGKKIDYSKFTEAGNYTVKISATDGQNNETVEEAKLTINKKDEPTKPSTTNCKYGDSSYNTSSYILTVDITSNGCAVSLDLYKDSSMTTTINKIMETETQKIKRDVEALNLSGTLALNRKVTAIVNNAGDGIVGYELLITVNITNNNKTEKVVEYKVDKNGNRVFVTNPYKLTK